MARAVLMLILLVGLLPSATHAGFTDVTVSAGVDYLQYQVPVPLALRGPEYMTGGAAVGDYDGDGWDDLYVTCFNDHDVLFRNKGDGSFEDVTSQAGLDAFVLKSNGAAFGDVDNDADLDLYVTTHEGSRFYLFINDGQGGFSEEGLARGAAVSGPDEHYGFSVTFGDYDRDGFLDLHVNEWRRDSVWSGHPEFPAPSNTRLLHNLGSSNPGYFEDVTVAAGVAMDDVPQAPGVDGATAFTSRFVDLDEDGWLDLAIAADFGSSRLFWNNGDGSFSDGTVAAGVGTDENGMGSAIGDVDGDGRLDWFVTSIYDPLDLCQCDNGLTGNRLFRNEGSRLFTDQTDSFGVRDAGWGWGAAFLDYDNDGDLDLAANNGQDWPSPFVPGADYFMNDAVRLWRNDGASMTEVASLEGLPLSGSGKGVLRFDYDRDGDQDLFFVTNTGHPALYRNDSGNSNDWIRVVPIGFAQNFWAVGARVEVTATSGGATQVQVIEQGSHFLGQSESVAHFGLGPGPGGPVHEIKITWPKTGKVNTYSNVPRNDRFVVWEPKPGKRCGLDFQIAPLLVGLAALRLRRRRSAN